MLTHTYGCYLDCIQNLPFFFFFKERRNGTTRITFEPIWAVEGMPRIQQTWSYGGSNGLHRSVTRRSGTIPCLQRMLHSRIGATYPVRSNLLLAFPSRRRSSALSVCWALPLCHISILFRPSTSLGLGPVL